MGRLINGINGPIQGRVGTVIGSSWKGIPYIKGPYKKRTLAITRKEAGNRDKFGEAHFWLKPLLDFVREGFKGYTPTVEGFLAAKSHLLLNAFEGIPPKLHVNPALARVSFGDLPLPVNIAVEKAAAGRLAFSWDSGAIDGGHPKDQVMMLAYNTSSRKAYFNTLGQFRSAGADTLNTDPTPGKTYHIYCSFIAGDRSRQSDSVYLGTITM